jgi:hypothetical protein
MELALHVDQPINSDNINNKDIIALDNASFSTSSIYSINKKPIQNVCF